MKYSQVRADLFRKIQLGAGILLSEFTPNTGEFSRTNIIAATDGGAQFQATQNFTDFGDGIDHVPADTKELKRIDSTTVTLSGNFKTMDTAVAKMLMASATIDGIKVTPNAQLSVSAFDDIWWVGDYSDINEDGATAGKAGFIAIKIINALSTGGFQLQSANRDKGTFAFTFTGHYSIEDTSVVPYEVYIQDGTTQ